VDRVRLCRAKFGAVNDPFDRVLSGFEGPWDRPAAGSAPISVERPPTPRESRYPWARPAGDGTDRSQFHDVDSGEDVDDRPRGSIRWCGRSGSSSALSPAGPCRPSRWHRRCRRPRRIRQASRSSPRHKNPFARSVNVPFEFATGFGVGSERRAGESMNVQPVLPVSLPSGWTLIALPSLSVTYEPPPDEALGLQDLQLSLILTPTRADRWIWGIGPIFQFPSASTLALGTGKWSAGPTGGVACSRDPVNLTSVEILVSYNFHSGWYVQFDPVNSYDWTADRRNAWDGPGRPRRGQGVEPRPAVDQRAARRLQARRASRGRPGLGRPGPDPVFVPDGQVGFSGPCGAGERPTKVSWRRDRQTARIPGCVTIRTA
jgi:hypothetical protein